MLSNVKKKEISMKRPNAYFLFFLQFFLILNFNCFMDSPDPYG